MRPTFTAIPTISIADFDQRSTLITSLKTRCTWELAISESVQIAFNDYGMREVIQRQSAIDEAQRVIDRESAAVIEILSPKTERESGLRLARKAK